MDHPIPPNCKDIPGYRGYCISSNSEVWSAWTSGQKLAVWKRLRPWRTGAGYLMVDLSKNGVIAKKSISRLMLLTFVGPCKEPEIFACHKNGDKNDNRIENLRWGTPASNSIDMIEHGNSCVGECNKASKLNEKQVYEIRRIKREEGIGSHRLARQFGVNATTIKKVLRGETWRHVR